MTLCRVQRGQRKPSYFSAPCAQQESPKTQHFPPTFGYFSAGVMQKVVILLPWAGKSVANASAQLLPKFQSCFAGQRPIEFGAIIGNLQVSMPQHCPGGIKPHFLSYLRSCSVS
jgi:hypothetical protein